MKHRVLFLALAALIVALPALAQSEPLHPCFTNWKASHTRTSCAFLKAWCSQAPPEQILALAMSRPPGLGTCYAHDDSDGYPYAAHFYVKQSWRSDQKGYDGGTGAIGWNPPVDYATAAALAGQTLKNLCSNGECCCPALDPKSCPDNRPVDAWDPLTKTCCTFANRCTMPADWVEIIDSADSSNNRALCNPT